MAKYLHQLSAVLFYVLGSLMFLAYVLFRNDIIPGQTLRFLMTADLPVLLVAMLYGGLSVYLSVDDHKGSRILAWIIGLPLTLAFLVFVVLNFWKAAH